MSMIYTIEVSLAIQFNHKNLERIFSSGGNRGFVYFEYDSEECLINENKWYAADHLAHFVFETIANGIDSALFESCIENTYLFTQCKKDQNGEIILHFSITGHKWKSWFRNSDDCLDYQRYLRSLLDLCNTFPIKSIKTYCF